MSRFKLDVLDFLIETLREHEKRLDWLVIRVEEIVPALEGVLRRLSPDSPLLGSEDEDQRRPRR